MARIARAVAPGLPHHITQRGNRRQQTFFSEDDYRAYIDLMAEWCARHGVRIWAYCLMPNHVHLVAVPPEKESLNLAIGEAHRRYTRRVNAREGWKGHLWQGRFASYILDEEYLLACVRYIERNPVRAGLVTNPEDWPWSSAAAHIKNKNDALVDVKPVKSMIRKRWADFLSTEISNDEAAALQKHERTGRPLGSREFVEDLEDRLGRALLPQKPGPRPDTRKRRRKTRA
ncbi:MAG: REP-associated tyrosine transposase [Thermodesulfobacteriota bacterium]